MKKANIRIECTHCKYEIFDCAKCGNDLGAYTNYVYCDKGKHYCETCGKES